MRRPRVSFPRSRSAVTATAARRFTNDDGLIELLRSIRIHGQGADKYENVRIGVNSRLDTIQAAILLEKMKVFPEEIELRDEIAKRYIEGARPIQPHPRAARHRRRRIDLGAIHDPGARSRQARRPI